ncbi:hypothetical protein GCM10018963_32180 [Saccharothrix longispora]
MRVKSGREFGRHGPLDHDGASPGRARRPAEAGHHTDPFGQDVLDRPHVDLDTTPAQPLRSSPDGVRSFKISPCSFFLNTRRY